MLYSWIDDADILTTISEIQSIYSSPIHQPLMDRNAEVALVDPPIRDFWSAPVVEDDVTVGGG